MPRRSRSRFLCQLRKLISELPGRAFLTEEADAFETEEGGVERRPGDAEDLGVRLDDTELLPRQEITHLARGPFYAFELGHVSPP